jgi:type II secretory pathway pseudopilin PulG
MTGRDRMVVVVVVVIAAIAGSWLMVVAPKRSQASKLADQVKAEQSQLSSAQSQLAQAQSARAEFARDYTSVARLGEAVPADDNVPSLIFQVQSAASAAKVDFRLLKLTSSGSSSAPSPVPTSSGSATQAAAATLPPGATLGPAGFPTEPFTFSFDGSFFHLADFFNRLQRFVVATDKRLEISGRLMTLNAINLSAAPQGFPMITASISATTFLVPATEGLTNGATAAGPSSSQAVSASPASTPAPAATVAAPVK